MSVVHHVRPCFDHASNIHGYAPCPHQASQTQIQIDMVVIKPGGDDAERRLHFALLEEVAALSQQKDGALDSAVESLR